jgi:zinc protease
VILVETSRDLPLVRTQVVVARGAAADSPEHDGRTNFASEMMARGAGGKTRAQLDAAFDALGGSLEIVTDYDAVYFEITVLRDKLDAALTLVSDVLLRPDFPADEAEKLKRELRGQLDDLRDDDGSLARRFFARALYGGHPYGRTVLGTEQSIEALDVTAARQWRELSLKPENMMFGFAGDIDEKAARAALERHFAPLARDVPFVPPAMPPDPPAPAGLRLTLVDKPERTQSQILIGQPAPRWGTDEFTALQVATCAYGGTFTARLMNEVRSKRGLSYGASARVGQGRGRKSLVVHVFPSLDQTGETLALVLGLHEDLLARGITEEERVFAAGYLAKSAAFGVATPEDRLDLAAHVALCGLPPDWGTSFPSRVRKVTLEDTRAALKNFSPRDLHLCIVSTAEQLLPKLEAAGLLKGVRLDVVPYDSY